MLSPRNVTLLFILLCWLLSSTSIAQGFLGLSINYGDRLTLTPDTDLILNRRSFSPTLTYTYQWITPSKFCVLAGVQSGVMGYQLTPELSYPPGSEKERFPLGDYENFVGRLEVALGKVVSLGEKELIIGGGGGASYYWVFPSTSMGVHVQYQGSSVQVFSAQIDAPVEGTFAGFAKVYAKVSLSKRLDLALQYSRHWRSVLYGRFAFRNLPAPVSGTITLVPQGVSFVLICRLKSNRTSMIRSYTPVQIKL